MYEKEQKKDIRRNIRKIFFSNSSQLFAENHIEVNRCFCFRISRDPALVSHKKLEIFNII